MAMFDSVKRSLGMRVESDALAARGQLEAMRDDSVEGRFAAGMAKELALLDNAQLRRALPNGGADVEGAMPGHKHFELRELHIAKGLKDYAERHVRLGASSPVGRELGPEARRQGMLALSKVFKAEHVWGKTVHHLVDNISTTLEDNTRAYLGVGLRNERAITRAADKMQAFERGPEISAPGRSKRDELSREVAMARAGVISPKDVVLAANHVDVETSMKEENVLRRHHGEPDMVRVVPNFEKGRLLGGVAREAEIERSRTSMARVVPLSLVKHEGPAISPTVAEGKVIPVGVKRPDASIAASIAQGVQR